MPNTFDPAVWAGAQAALDKLVDVPEDQRQGKLEALNLSAPERQVLHQMLDSMELPGLLDHETGVFHFSADELSVPGARLVPGV